MSIKRKIIFIILGISIISLTVFCATAFWGLLSIKSQTKTSSIKLGEFAAKNGSDFLEREAIDKLVKRTKDQSQIINERLLKIAEKTIYFSEYTGNIYKNAKNLLPVLIPFSTSTNKGKLVMQLQSANGKADYQTIKREADLLGNITPAYISNIYDMNITAAVYLGTESGFSILYDTFSDDESQTFDPRTRLWYIGAKKINSTFWTDPYIDAASGKFMVTCSYPFYGAGGEFMGVTGMDVIIEDLNNEIMNIDVGENGYAFIIDKEGILISSKELKKSAYIKNNAEYNNIINKMIEGKTGIEKVSLNGVDIYIAYSQIPVTNWSIATVQPLSDIMGLVDENNSIIQTMTNSTLDFVNSTIKITLAIFVIVFVLVIIAIIFFSKKLSARITDPIIAELNVATKIQASMLPKNFPAFPHRDDFDIYATMLTAKEVGGDFYDFFLIDENTLAVVMADVSGKGIPAALFMIVAKTLIKNNAQQSKSPSEVFETVNNMLCENNDAQMFVTAFMGYLSLDSGKFVFVNAGHNPPIVRSNGKNEFLKMKPGLVLAGMENVSFKQDEIVLQKGDEVFLYTDGVTEAVNNEHVLFGEKRLIKAVNNYCDLPLKEFTASIKHEIDKFAEGAEQADDITMLALRVG